MSKSKFLSVLLLASAIIIIVTGCHKSSPTLEVGGIYSVNDSKTGYGVVKLLLHEDRVCHVRIYKQKFPTRPATIDISTLSLGKPGDPDGFGMGHIPMRESSFLEWQPVLITKTPVTAEELEGHRIWKASGGGIF